MSVFFADSSALIKRYVAETGSVWVRGWADPVAGNTVVISRLTTVEVIAGLARRKRENSISAADFAALRGRFISDADKFYTLIGLRVHILNRARDLIPLHSLRTLDAIQLACALDARKTLGAAIIFVSADHRLLAAAVAEGFVVEDPEQHP